MLQLGFKLSFVSEDVHFLLHVLYIGFTAVYYNRIYCKRFGSQPFNYNPNFGDQQNFISNHHMLEKDDSNVAAHNASSFNVSQDFSQLVYNNQITDKGESSVQYNWLNFSTPPSTIFHYVSRLLLSR
jgi:hypothetical protein